MSGEKFKPGLFEALCKDYLYYRAEAKKANASGDWEVRDIRMGQADKTLAALRNYLNAHPADPGFKE